MRLKHDLVLNEARDLSELVKGVVNKIKNGRAVSDSVVRTNS